jgi:hypothetical protein
LEKFYKKHPEHRPPIKPDQDEEPEEPKVEIKFVSEEILKQWNGDRITDILQQLPPDIPITENRPNRRTINPIRHGFAIIEPKNDNDGKFQRGHDGKFVMGVTGGEPVSDPNRMRKEDLVRIQ